MENNTGDKKPDGGGFYTYRGDKAAEKAQPAGADSADINKVADGPDAQCEAEPGQPDAPPDKGRQVGRIVAIALAAMLGIGLVLSIVYDQGRLGLTGASATTQAAAPTKTSKIKPVKTGSTDAALFLYAQPWDDKKHDSMKSLKKVTNLRYALAFFQEFTPVQIEAVPTIPCEIADVSLNYKEVAGAIVTFTVKISGKEALTEELQAQNSQTSVLLTLPGDPSYGGASLIVMGSQLPGVNAGDTVRCSCIPIYYYTPKGGASGGGLLFITIPELVSKVS